MAAPATAAAGGPGHLAAAAASRLIIPKMVIENFKSYGGVKEIGPFHKSFSSVVGPNGSGKSNVIDAMLFVFGKKASQMRFNKVRTRHVRAEGWGGRAGALRLRRVPPAHRRKRTDRPSQLSELIHRSAEYPALDYARVSVFFQDIVDDGSACQQQSAVAALSLALSPPRRAPLLLSLPPPLLQRRRTATQLSPAASSLSRAPRTATTRPRTTSMTRRGARRRGAAGSLRSPHAPAPPSTPRAPLPAAIPGHCSSMTEVTTLLKGRGIDLDHNRFLILQGEVEQIAMMKPKGAAPGDEGLLEYLEDIIGSIAYVAPIAEAEKVLDALNGQRAEKLNRLKAVEKERGGLESAKAEAEALLAKEREVSRQQGALFQKLAGEAGEAAATAERRHGDAAAKLADARAKLAALTTAMAGLTAEAGGAQAGADAAVGDAARLRERMAACERKEVKLKEDMKGARAAAKKLEEAIGREGAALAEAGRAAEAAAAALPGLEASLKKLQVRRRSRGGALPVARCLLRHPAFLPCRALRPPPHPTPPASPPTAAARRRTRRARTRRTTPCSRRCAARRRACATRWRRRRRL